MELIEVEITGQAITARYGTLNTGDILRTDAEFAKHLVEDCAAAKYTTAKPAKPAKVVAPVAPVPRKRRTFVAAPSEATLNTDEQAPTTQLPDATPGSTDESQGEPAPVNPAADAATE